uniref:Polymerase PA n=1 Tax=Hemipteran orthomyxo-related virus OKIAV188 TaxID=2746271 RepID=A0A7D7F172_9ORTO|nr:polymerase PA [Hemipteran orthomyxo-related virus OKIAV188]
MDIYEELIRSERIYLREFVRSFGEDAPHWFNESWRSREESLRHDYCCVLLCNLETFYNSKRKALTPLVSPSKRPRPDSPQPSTSSTETVFEVPTREFRMVLLEGNPSAPSIQAQYEKEFGCEKMNKVWDLIDKKERKFIELKVSPNRRDREMEFLMDLKKCRGNHSLCVVDPGTGEISWYNHPGGLDGESKVTSFILQRKLYMTSHNHIETPLDFELDLSKEIFASPWFNNNVDEWVKGIWDLRHLPEPPNYNIESGESLYEVTCERLLEKLEDPSKRTTEIVKWKGKILCEPMVANIYTRTYEDKNLVTEFFNLVGQSEEIKRIGELWLNREDCYNLVNHSELNQVENGELSKMCGWNMKRRTFDPSDETTRMPEPKERIRLKYHEWFDHLIRELGEQHGQNGKPFQQILEEEWESVNPMSLVAKRAISNALQFYSKRHTSVFASKLVNFYSRLGKNYTPANNPNNKTRKNIVIFPIYATMYDENGETFRLLSGVCLRGPMHARKTTDKIAIVTIELLNNDPYYHDKIHKGKVFKTDLDIDLCMRVNSIERNDPNYLIFVNNSLLVAMNLLGELVLNNPTLPHDADLLQEISRWENRYQEWLHSRVVEGVLMAATGRSQEEGFYAQYRKIFMCLLAIKRKEKCFGWDIEGLCNKTNECIIDSPLPMHLQLSLISLLKGYDVATADFTNVDLMLQGLAL